MNARNTMAFPYHSKVRSTQIMEVQLFPCLGYGTFGKGIFFFLKTLTCQTQLTFNVSMKMVNKLCVSDGVYNLFKSIHTIGHGFIEMQILDLLLLVMYRLTLIRHQTSSYVRDPVTDLVTLLGQQVLLFFLQVDNQLLLLLQFLFFQQQ